MKLQELTSTSMPLRASKIHTEAMDGNLKIKTEVTKLNWARIRATAIYNLAQGNKNLRELYNCSLKLKYGDNTPEAKKTAYLVVKAIKSNELLLSNAIVFLLQAEIEKHKKKLPHKSMGRSSSDVILKAQKILKQSDALLSDYQLQLYTLALQKRSQQEITNKCFEFSAFIEEYILKLAEDQVKLIKILEAYKTKGITNNVKKLGFLLAQMNQVTREYISSFIASHFFVFMLAGLNIDRDISLLKKIQLMPFDIDFPDGKDIEIKEVPNMEEDKFVETRGFVKSLSLVDGLHGKSTKVVLKDLSTKDEATVIMPFVNIQVYGLAVGAYCNINGYIKHADGESTILIDKLRLSTSLESAWRVAFLNLSSPLYFYWPKNLNMCWSIAAN